MPSSVLAVFEIKQMARAKYKHGRDETRSERQRYHCRNCNRYFDDLTGTIFEGQHQPLMRLDIVLVFHGVKPVQQPDCLRTRPGLRVMFNK